MRAAVVLTLTAALIIGSPAPSSPSGQPALQKIHHQLFSFFKRPHASPGGRAAELQNTSSSTSQSQEFLGDAKNLSITNLNVLAQDAVQNDRDQNFVYLDSLMYKAKERSRSLEISREEFYGALQKQRKINEGQEEMQQVGKALWSFGEQLAELGGPVGVFAFKAGDTYLDRFNEKLRESSEEALREEMRQFFGGRKLDKRKLENALSKGPATFAAEVKAQAGLPDAFDDLPEKQRDLALKQLVEFTLGTMAVSGQRIEIVQRGNEAKLKKARDRISNIEVVQKCLTDGMSKLMKDTEENAKGLAAISTELNKQGQDLGLIQRLMFGHLSVDEQLELVKNSNTLGLTDPQRKKLEGNLENRKSILESARKWNDFVRTGRDLLGITDKLGVDRNVISGLQQGLAAGDSLYSAVNVAISGNYIGAVTAVLGIFGGGGVDAETVHYQAIMGKLDEIIETQKKIIAIQQAILNELGRIETLIVRNQMQLLSQLNKIYVLQAHTLEAVVDTEKSKLNNCEYFLQRRYSAEGFQKEENRFESYRLMQAHFEKYQEDYRECVLALNQSIGTITGTHANFFGYPALEAVAEEKRRKKLTEVRESIHNSVLPLFRYAENYVPDADRDKRTIEGSFFTPSLDFGALKKKEALLVADAKAKRSNAAAGTSREAPVSPDVEALRTLRPISTAGSRKDDPSVQFYYTAFEDLKSGEDIIKYAETEMLINQYRELTADNRERLLNPRELYNHRDASATDALKTAFDWLTLAIAQQNFLGGDSLLRFLNEDGFRQYSAPAVTLDQLLEPPGPDQKADDKRAALAHYVLGHNYMLLQNALRYRMFSLMDGGKDGEKISAAAYTWAWRATQDAFYLNHLFGDSIPIERLERKPDDPPGTPQTGWYFRYHFIDYDVTGKKPERDVLVALPEPQDVLTKSFVVPGTLRELLICRYKVNTLLAEHQLGLELSKDPERLAQLKLLLLMQNYKPRAAMTRAPSRPREQGDSEVP
jgi:hypothetical protein